MTTMGEGIIDGLLPLELRRPRLRVGRSATGQ